MCFSIVARWRRGESSSGIVACMSSERWISPEMPASVTKSRYFLSRPAEISPRAPVPIRGSIKGREGARDTRATSFPFFFHASAAPSIVDATPPPPHHHHRSLPTGCPRRPARHPSRRRTPQHHRCTPPHPSGRCNAATAAADASRRTQRQPRPPHATPTAPHTQPTDAVRK